MTFSGVIRRSLSSAAANILPQLERTLPANSVFTAEIIREQHGHDESHHKTKMPDIVVKPESVEEVSAVMRLCNQSKCPVIPFGSGSGLEGGVTAPEGGVCIDLMNLTKLDVHTDDFDCTVGAGILRKALNQNIRDTGLWFPIDPGADASLCGMVATSASGTNAVRYGTMRENTINLQVVLPDGRIIHTRGEGRRPKKSSAGLNITNLFVGSEGLLGCITEASIKLYPYPETMGAAVCSFPSVASAVETVLQVLQCSVPMARIEFLDEVMIDACNKYSKLDFPLTPHLFMEFHGSKAEVEAQAELVGDLCRENGGNNLDWSSKTEDREKLWKARHNAYYAALALRPGCKGKMTDVCVPISKLPEVLVETKKDLDASWIPGPIVGHVGDGNFHLTFPVFTDNPEELAEVERVNDRMIKSVAHHLALVIEGTNRFVKCAPVLICEVNLRRALAVGGTCTGEHGVGVGKRKYMELELGVDTVDIMKTIKTAIDPNGIMNPGKMFS